jgi:hypothetical protein
MDRGYWRLKFFLLRHAPWISTAFIGVILVAGGVFLVVKGIDARNEIQRELRAEQVITSADARTPGVLVEDSDTARAQADVIKDHTLGRWGPYSKLPREDPRRASFIDGVALRTALNMSVMGFALADLAIAGGIIILIAGGASIALAAPAIYFLAGMVVPAVRKETDAAD